jgi:general L-amino acid transport system substrate-binding protein
MDFWHRTTMALPVIQMLLLLALVGLVTPGLCGAAAAPASSASEMSETITAIKSRGILRCGVSDGLTGFSAKDANGRWTGMDVEFCRAVAAAVLGDPEKVTFIPLSASARFPALRLGDIDLLTCHSSWTLGHEMKVGALFAGIIYYDWQTFLVPAESHVEQLSDLNEKTICVVKGTTHVELLPDYFRARGLSFKPLVSESLQKATEAFFNGSCQAISSDRSVLASVRLKAPGGPEEYVVLAEQISKEPLGPVVRRGDDLWFSLVRWVLFALIGAEMDGISRENVREKLNTGTNLDAVRYFNAGAGVAKALNIPSDWLVRVIESVGNYGEMYERNLGNQSALKLERGLNRLWTDGGLMYAPVFR